MRRASMSFRLWLCGSTCVKAIVSSTTALHSEGCRVPTWSAWSPAKGYREKVVDAGGLRAQCLPWIMYLYPEAPEPLAKAGANLGAEPTLDSGISKVRCCGTCKFSWTAPLISCQLSSALCAWLRCGGNNRRQSGIGILKRGWPSRNYSSAWWLRGCSTRNLLRRRAVAEFRAISSQMPRFAMLVWTGPSPPMPAQHP